MNDEHLMCAVSELCVFELCDFGSIPPVSKNMCNDVQVIFSGKTSASLPPAIRRSGKKFSDWQWTATENHWSNLLEQKNYVRLILVPYFRAKIEELQLSDSQKALYIIDCWPVHISADFRHWMKTEYPWILVLYVPPSCTGKLQPQDKFYQKPFKHAVMASFCEWQMGRYRMAQQTGMLSCT